MSEGKSKREHKEGAVGGGQKLSIGTLAGEGQKLSIGTPAGEGQKLSIGTLAGEGYKLSIGTLSGLVRGRSCPLAHWLVRGRSCPLVHWLVRGRSCPLIHWLVRAERALSTVKERLASQPILKLPDMSKTFTLQTDASGQGLEVLLQECDGKFPVRYASRTISECEQGYVIVEKECLAVI